MVCTVGFLQDSESQLNKSLDIEDIDCFKKSAEQKSSEEKRIIRGGAVKCIILIAPR